MWMKTKMIVTTIHVNGDNITIWTPIRYQNRLIFNAFLQQINRIFAEVKSGSLALFYLEKCDVSVWCCFFVNEMSEYLECWI